MSHRAPILGHGRRVEFLSILGRGGFGAVYLADLHGRDGFVQRVAIKVLNEVMSASADIAARQRDEGRLLARLNHDHIVKVYDLTEVHSRPAVIMEYVQGVDMAEVNRQGPVPSRVTLQAIASAASALDAAWRTPDPQTGRPLRVVHRDIKPSNLLLSRHGGLKVLDFGIARGDFDREGATGSVQFGTTRFMAPEQWLYRSVSDKVDVYALGVTAVELLAGASLERAPLDPARFASHMASAIDAVVDAQLPPHLGSTLRQLLTAMLAFEPANRPSAAEVYDAALELADELTGESLGRFARRVVPPLLDARTDQHQHDPLLSSARIDTPATAGPPVVNAPLLASERYVPPDAARSRPPRNIAANEPVPAVSPRAATVPYRDIKATLEQATQRQGRPTSTARSRRILPWLVPVIAASMVGTAAVGVSQMTESSEPQSTVPSFKAKDLRSTALRAHDTGSPPNAGPPVVRKPAPTKAAATEQPTRPLARPSPAHEPVPTRASPPPSPPSHPPLPAATPQGSAAPEDAFPVEVPTGGQRPEQSAPASASPKPLTRAVTVTSTPIGAHVSINGHRLDGTTPLHIDLPMGAHEVGIYDSVGRCDGTLTVSALAASTYRCTTATAALEAIR